MNNDLSATIDVEIKGILAITDYTLSYTNHSDSPVEAIYHFSLPRICAVMNCTVDIDGRRYEAQVKAQQIANDTYETALENKQRAVLIEMAGDGMYILNMGNLDAGETFQVGLKIGQMLTAVNVGKELIYRLPTNIAPRYGNSDHMIDPEYSLFARYPFAARVRGLTGNSVRACSHSLVEQGEDLVFSGLLDRDVFIQFAAQADASIMKGCWQGQTYHLGYPPLAQPEEGPERFNLHVVADRSGSMMGNSIALLRDALNEVVTQLPASSMFNLTSFGSEYAMFKPSLFEVRGTARRGLRQYIDSMQADMGGTEVIPALLATVKALPDQPDCAQQVLLITDGHVYTQREEIAAIAIMAARKRVHIHCIGVGVGANEDILARLSGETGGHCFMVNPHGEFKSSVTDLINALGYASQQALGQWLNADWQWNATTQNPALPTVTMARGEKAAFDGSDELVCDTVTGQWAQALVQIGAMQHYYTLEGEQSADLALKLQLLTNETSLVMVDIAGDQVEGNATTHVIEQMTYLNMPMFCKRSSHSDTEQTMCMSTAMFAKELEESDMDIPTLWDADKPKLSIELSADGFEQTYLNRIGALFRRLDLADREGCRKAGASDTLLRQLDDWCFEYGLPFDVVLSFYLAEYAVFTEQRVPRALRKRIAAFKAGLPPQLIMAIKDVFTASQTSPVQT